MESTTSIEESSSRRHSIFALKSWQIFLVSAITLMTLVITVLCIGFLMRYEVDTNVLDVDSVSFWKEPLTEEQRFWYNDGITELKEALQINWKPEQAQNVIIFIARGIGEKALAAVRFNENNEDIQKMVWEKFPHVGGILTKCSSTKKCDALSFSTALFGGVQTTPGIAGLVSTVDFQNCTQSMNETYYIRSIFELAQESNFRTGFVTTRRITGPLISALYGHTSDTTWECDAAVPTNKQLQGCKDIATQLIDDETGIKTNVIMGGGRQTLVSAVPITTWDPLDSTICNSEDGRSYIRDWRTLKRVHQQKNAVLQNSSELKKLNGSNVDFVLGIFANGNIKPSWQRNSTDNHMPELSDMVGKALEVLKRKKQRFLLVVESGNRAENSIAEEIMELKRLNATLNKAMKNLSAKTLVVVLFVDENNIVKATETIDFGNSNTVAANAEKISGNLKILATGPSSFLFNSLHDETFMAHAISYALKIGTFRKPT